MTETARSPITIHDRTVVFDYGEVISVTPSDDDRRRILDIAQVDADAFWPPYQAHRDRLDEGTISVAEYWALVAADCGADWDDVTVRLLWVADFRSWLSVDAGTAAVLGDLVAGGTRLALLSNAGEDFGSYLRHGGIGDLFERVFVSGELKVVKPEAAIYRHVADELGITPAEMVFIDNKEVNVRGAEALGVTGHVFTGADGLRAFLVDLAPSAS